MRDTTHCYAVAFDVRVLDMSVVYHSPQLLQKMEKLAVEMIRSLKFARTFSETVSHAIMKRLDGTVPRIEDVSRSLGVSVRLLQVRLQDENTTFKELLASIRRNVAERLLADRSVPIGDIAYALGFSSPAAYHNAFKQWTGQTACSFRKAAMEACVRRMRA